MHASGDHDPGSSLPVEELEREVRALRERLAFYEGFDLLIQDNVAHARELMRLAAQEREGVAASAERTRSEAAEREAAHRAELEAIQGAIEDLAAAVAALSARVSHALRSEGVLKASAQPALPDAESSLSLVVHGVTSARSALSLQHFVASQPQVTNVTAREYAGGVLRLEAQVRDRLRIDQLRDWDGSRRVEPLTERRDVIEFALIDASH